MGNGYQTIAMPANVRTAKELAHGYFWLVIAEVGYICEWSKAVGTLEVSVKDAGEGLQKTMSRFVGVFRLI